MRRLTGGLSFTEFFLLHLTGKAPAADRAFFLDAMPVGLAEHGVTPSVQAARMTLAAALESLQGAVAAGVAGAGSMALGAAEEAGRLPVRGVGEAAGNAETFEETPRRIAEEIRAARRPVPGFGHLYGESRRPMGFLLAHHAEAAVEYDGEPPPPDPARRIRAAIRSELIVATGIEPAPHRSLPRRECKSRLVDLGRAG